MSSAMGPSHCFGYEERAISHYQESGRYSSGATFYDQFGGECGQQFLAKMANNERFLFLLALAVVPTCVVGYFTNTPKWITLTYFFVPFLMSGFFLYRRNHWSKLVSRWLREVGNSGREDG